MRWKLTSSASIAPRILASLSNRISYYSPKCSSQSLHFFAWFITQALLIVCEAYSYWCLMMRLKHPLSLDPCVNFPLLTHIPVWVRCAFSVTSSHFYDNTLPLQNKCLFLWMSLLWLCRWRGQGSRFLHFCVPVPSPVPGIYWVLKKWLVNKWLSPSVTVYLMLC